MNERLHIAHIVLSLQPGGLENGVVNVINGLDRTRFRSSVVCLKVAGEFASRIQAPDTQVVAMGMKPGLDWRIPFRVARWLKQERVDIVHTRNAESFFFGSVAAKLARSPHLIHSEHGRTFDDKPRRFLAQRVLTRWTDRVFAVSSQLKEDLCHHVRLKPGQIDVLHNGVDLSRFNQASDARERARNLLNLPSTVLVVGSVGRLVAVKNFGLLLDALASPALSHVHAALIGDGPLRGELQSKINAHGLTQRVHLLGHRDDVPALLPGLDVFVLPSISEGMSNTLLEAMACGIAPVASRVGGNGEIVTDGESGFLFESGSEPGLRQALEALCHDNDLRRSIGQRARQRVLSAFDIRVMIRNYEALYERVAFADGARRCPV